MFGLFSFNFFKVEAIYKATYHFQEIYNDREKEEPEDSNMNIMYNNKHFMETEDLNPMPLGNKQQDSIGIFSIHKKTNL